MQCEVGLCILLACRSQDLYGHLLRVASHILIADIQALDDADATPNTGNQTQPPSTGSAGNGGTGTCMQTSSADADASSGHPVHAAGTRPRLGVYHRPQQGQASGGDEAHDSVGQQHGNGSSSSSAPAGKGTHGMSRLPPAPSALQRLQAFGDVEEVLFHYERSGTADGRAAMLQVLLHHLCGERGETTVWPYTVTIVWSPYTVHRTR